MPNVTTGETRILPYTVEVRLLYASSSILAAPAVNGELAVVDRSASYFGGGWWLAGLEQLSRQSDGSALWVAGDGSTRKYVAQGTAGSDTVFLASAFTSPDTLLRRADGKYQRQAGNGLFVEFSSAGLHQKTVNRQGYATVFNYDGSGHLSTLQLPPVQAGGSPAHTYSFVYNAASTLLDNVVAPSVDGMTRTVALGRDGTTARVLSITELLGGSTYKVMFDTQPGLVYGARTDRRGVRTSVAYEASSSRVARFNTATGVDTITVEHRFRTADSVVTAVVSQPLDSAYSRYDGPRPLPVSDVSKFWLDRFGAPQRIVNALNEETRIERGDPRFPGLVTETRGSAPKNFTTWASYDARGNLRTSTQASPHDDGVDATTTYAWHPKWTMVTQVMQPEGEVTNIAYSDSGDRLWQEDGRGATSRVKFEYYPSTDAATGAMARMLGKIVLPTTATLASTSSRIRYDVLGNVDTTWTLGGTWSAATQDAIGRTITTATQISDAGNAAESTTSYDLSDRVTRQISVGPAMNGAPRQTVTVESYYDPEGRLDSLARSQGPEDLRSYNSRGFPALGRMVTLYGYDNLGRKVAEIAPDSTREIAIDNPVDSTFHDRAGNVVSVRTRRFDSVGSPDTTHHMIQMTYDALNRLKTRTVPDAKYRARVDGYAKQDAGNQESIYAYNTPYPRFPNNSYAAANAQQAPAYPAWGGYTVGGYTATYDYDAAGNMTVANNQDARVWRQYYANGQLQYDSLHIQSLERNADRGYGLE
ncbi:MAG: hypothetical protein LH467_10365, partial [Gemmatimonadaceae bacterium]|nr:hypothetical protein [Gemmatimonadaceae bacterium]